MTLALVLFTISSCSVEPIDNDLKTPKTNVETIASNETVVDNQEQSLNCSNADPQATFTNNGTAPFHFKVLTTDASLISEELNVMPGATTNVYLFPAGDVIFSIESMTTGIPDMKTFFTMDNCTEIFVEVDSSNHLVDTQPVVVD